MRKEYKEIHDKVIISNNYYLLDYIEGTGASGFKFTGNFQPSTLVFSVTYSSNRTIDTNWESVLLGRQWPSGYTHMLLTPRNYLIMGLEYSLNYAKDSGFKTVYYNKGSLTSADGVVMHTSTISGSYYNSMGVCCMYASETLEDFMEVGVKLKRLTFTSPFSHDFVPVSRISDGKAGFLDIITNTFYQSETSTPFVAEAFSAIN